jgi:hypothetical protein
MQRIKRAWIVGLLTVACLTVFVPSANAYVDPGAGSFVFQAVIGGILAVAVAVKLSWKRLIVAVTRRDRRDRAPEQ